MIYLTALRRLVSLVPAWAWVLAAALAWGAWQRHQVTVLAEQHRERDQQALLASERYRAQERATATKAQKAANALTIELAATRRDAGAARSERDRLLDQLAAADRAASAPHPACGDDDAAKARTVVAECVGRLQEVAEDADAHRARVIGLQQFIRAERAGR